MFDLSPFIDLPFAWGMIMALAIFMYVLLDGFDLGVGILFPFAPSRECRDIMIHSVAPFWDGNETWLVLGGGGLFVAFPLAYAILMPAFYIPIIVMLFGLIVRGAALEFRAKSIAPTKTIWDYAFHYGSLTATLAQGMILGGFIRGISVEGRHFSGTAFDWLNGFSIMTGIALVFGYMLLGATWLILKTQGQTQRWARRVAAYASIMVGVFMLVVSGAMPFMDPHIMALWFSLPSFFYLLPVPCITFLLFMFLWRDLYKKQAELRPFLLSMGIFATGYLGLGISLFPWMIPYQYTLHVAAASPFTLSLMLVGVLPLLPLILGYTAYSYYVFRGKTVKDDGY